MELTTFEEKVVEALKMLKADNPDKLKTADTIAKAAVVPKGMVGNVLISLVQKGIAKRVAREKAAGYYLLK